MVHQYYKKIYFRPSKVKSMTATGDYPPECITLVLQKSTNNMNQALKP